MAACSYFVLLLTLTTTIFDFSTNAEDDSDKLWLLFDHTNLFECAGVTNQYKISKDDISIRDQQGKLAYYLECPNMYTISFDNIKVLKALPNIAGHLAATLQVPLVQGPAGLSLDFPYQCVPQKQLLQASQCDNESGVYTDPAERKEYCRYCDICDSSSHAEKKVSTEALGHKYVDIDESNSFNKVCRNINAQTYSIKRQVSVPGKKELEDSANANVKGGLTADLEKKLKIGKGKLQIFLKLISSSGAPVQSAGWYRGTKGCECCVKDAAGNSACKQQSSFLSGIAGGIFAGSGNNCLKCNNQYVQQCLTGQPQVVGCYTVEYNFRVTDKRSDVVEFQKQIDYQNNANKAKYTDTDAKLSEKVNVLAPTVVGTGTNSNTNTNTNTNQAVVSGNTGSSGGKAPCSKCSKDACMKGITFPPTTQYCSSWWDTPSARNYCCTKCPSVCTV
jgi:hypothetical protein